MAIDADTRRSSQRSDPFAAPSQPTATLPHNQPETLPTATPPATSEPKAAVAQPDAVATQQALNAAVADAEKLGGKAQAAVWVEGWPAPLASPRISSDRMWSLSKVLTALTVIRLSDGGKLSSTVARAIERALIHSENCPQRRVVLELQQLAGGSAGARAALQETLKVAGAGGEITTTVQTADSFCHSYLRRVSDSIGDPLGPGLLLGTSTWTVADAARFMAALADGRYGEPGNRILALLRRPKGVNTEAPPGNYSADPAWGAGRALTRLDPAYKAGWGGSLQGSFQAGQMAVFDVGGRSVAVAAVFRPTRQPDRDDPGRTTAPTAIEGIFTTLRRHLER